MFTAGVHAIAETWGQPKCPFINTWIDTENGICVTQWNNIKPLKGNLAFCDNVNQMCYAEWNEPGRESPILYAVWHKHHESCSVVSGSLQPHGLYSPWNSPGQTTGVSSLSFSGGSSQPRNQIGVSCIAGRFFTNWATRKAHVSTLGNLKKKKKKGWFHIKWIEWWLPRAKGMRKWGEVTEVCTFWLESKFRGSSIQNGDYNYQ